MAPAGPSQASLFTHEREREIKRGSVGSKELLQLGREGGTARLVKKEDKERPRIVYKRRSMERRRKGTV